MARLSNWQGRRHRIKNFIHSLSGRDVFLRVETRCQRRRLGKASGAWEVCPELLAPGSIVYSLGVGRDVSFDVSVIDEYRAEVHAFDPTPLSIEWVRRQALHDRFHFYPYGVSDRDGSATLYPPCMQGHDSFSIVETRFLEGQPLDVPVKRLATIMRELGHTRIDLLKMDIEGAEYGVLRDMLDSGIAPAQLLVEFHHRFPSIGAEATRRAVQALGELGYRIFYVSPNSRECGFLLR